MSLKYSLPNFKNKQTVFQQYFDPKFEENKMFIGDKSTICQLDSQLKILTFQIASEASLVSAAPYNICRRHAKGWVTIHS